jgi:hypothetical protein
MQTEMELVSVAAVNNTDGSLRAAFLQLQNADGEHAGYLLRDVSAAQALLDEWAAYRAQVDAAIAAGTPWPQGPRYTMTLAPVAP